MKALLQLKKFFKHKITAKTKLMCQNFHELSSDENTSHMLKTPAVSIPVVDYYALGAASVQASVEAKNNFVDQLLSMDVPSRFHQNDFYWKWFNARRLLSNFVWDIFSANALYHYAAQNGPTAKNEISQNGIVLGSFSQEETQRLQMLYHQCKPIPFDGDDFEAGYFFDPNMVGAISAERGHVCTFFEMSSELKNYLNGWLVTNKAVLEKLLGHYWCISTIRLFTLNPGTSQYGADHWHTDGWPLAMKKLQIYLCDVDSYHGTTEFKLKTGEQWMLTGKAGIWALFENSTIFHRAIPPQNGVRPTIELSFVPALNTQAAIKNAGVNAGYSWFPLEAVDSADVCVEFAADLVKYRAYLRTLALTPATENYTELDIQFDQVIPRRDPT